MEECVQRVRRGIVGRANFPVRGAVRLFSAGGRRTVLELKCEWVEG